MSVDTGRAAQHHGRMTVLQKFQRECRVLLARLLAACGPAVPDDLRQIADDFPQVTSSIPCHAQR